MPETASAESLLPPAVLRGEELWGNDFGLEQIDEWFRHEAQGFYRLAEGTGKQEQATFDHKAMNRLHAAPLRDRHWPVALALGCASGEDIRFLGLDIGRIVAIEPAQEWWADAIAGVPAEFRAPEPSGRIDLPDASVDLVIALGVRHPVPNVEFVVSELGRVLKPGGRAILREPVNSMGDFTRPRPNLTRNERGIPAGLMLRFIDRAGLRVFRHHYIDTPGIPHVLRRLGIEPYNSPLLVRLDRAISAALAWNVRYWRSSALAKLAPASALYLAEKPGG